MRSNYKPLGRYIQSVDIRNTDLKVQTLLGVSIRKVLMPSIANVIGTDMKTYKKIKKNQFAYGPVTSRNGDKISVAILDEYEEAIVSQAYVVFEVIDFNELDPEYLMMWFRRPEFDRYARFKSHGSAREIFDWAEMCETELPIPSIEKQREIVAEYNAVINRIKLNEQLSQKLEETAQALYKHWFVDFRETDSLVNLDKFVEFNPKHSIPKNKVVAYIEMSYLQEDLMSVKNIERRAFTAGSKFKNGDTLLARITPCLENGKTAFVDGLSDNEIAYGSTEFIVMRPKFWVSAYWIYCLARDDDFRAHAISSMIGSSGRQRVHSDYLKEFEVSDLNENEMNKFHDAVKPIFEQIRFKSLENQNLTSLKDLILSKMTKIEQVEVMTT
jgi:type I restriction enzyme S subunit